MASPDELVAEGQLAAGIAQQTGAQGRLEGGEELDRAPPHHRGELRQGEAPAEDRRHLQHPEGRLGQDAEPAQDGELQRRGHGHLVCLRPRSVHGQQTLVPVGGDELDDEQGVAPGPRHLAQQPRPGPGAGHRRGQVGHLVVVHRAEQEVTAAAGEEVLDGREQFGAARKGP